MPMVTSCVLVQLTFLAACVLLRNFSRFSLRLVAPLPDGSADGAPSDGSPEVQLSCGALHGTWSQGVAAFRGIRYGQAPLRQQQRERRPVKLVMPWRMATAVCREVEPEPMKAKIV